MLRRWLSIALIVCTLTAPLGRVAAAQSPDSAYGASAQPAYKAVAEPPKAEAPKSEAPPTERFEPPGSVAAPGLALAPGLSNRGADEWDPIEPVNRASFAFNDALDIFLIEPAARGWKAITPQGLRNSVDRFFINLRFPLRFVGCLVQGRVVDTGSELARFALNSTVGLAGFFDPARKIGLKLNDEDLGQGIGYWGVGPGPYVVFPVFGIYTARDLVNIPLESPGSFVPGLNALNAVNTRAGLLSEVREAKAASLDYYSFVRNAYLQRRRALVRNEMPEPQETGDELYEISGDQ